MRAAINDIRQLSVRILTRSGVPAEFAEIQSDLLIDAELRGLPSHGLLRLPRIVERIHNGVCNPNVVGQQTWRADSFLEVDGQMGLGPVVALAALDQISRRARATGVAIAAIRNNNHIGMAGWYGERAAREGLVALVWTTSEALVHPWGGTRAMIGTNPIAIAIPGSPRPFVLDVATSLVAMGKIHDYAHRAEQIPPHWAVDKDGFSTTDPQAAKEGAIAPFGKAKGYALGLGFELLVTCLTKSAIGTAVKGTLDSVNVCNKGDLFIVIEPDLTADVVSSIASYLDEIRACRPMPGHSAVRIPGDRAEEARNYNTEAGITVADEVWDSLQILSRDSVK